MKTSEISAALRTVIDPELNINIVDLGLVYALRPDETARQVRIEMTLSSKRCPMGESILSAAKNCIERTFPDHTAAVVLVWEPEWNYKFISGEGLKALRGY